MHHIHITTTSPYFNRLPFTSTVSPPNLCTLLVLLWQFLLFKVVLFVHFDNLKPCVALIALLEPAQLKCLLLLL